jgi:hypothetical protein
MAFGIGEEVYGEIQIKIITHTNTIITTVAVILLVVIILENTLTSKILIQGIIVTIK